MSMHAPVSDLPLFAPPAESDPEPAKAASILDRMADERRAWLERIRWRLKVLYLSRAAARGKAKAYVTADDARRFMEAQPERFALPAGASMNLLGALFRAKGWVKVAAKAHISETEGSHGNALDCWAWEGP